MSPGPLKNISGASLAITDNAADPVGTEYIILSPASGLITGNFASTSIPPTLSAPDYHGGAYVSVTRIAALPLLWGAFSVERVNEQSSLRWSTLQEQHTSHFVVEHSTDARRFTEAGTLPAAGNSDIQRDYTFIHPSPDLSKVNYYRIRQVDNDGGYTYSRIVAVGFENADKGIRIWPNLARSALYIRSPLKGQLAIFTPAGAVLTTLPVRMGDQQIDIRRLPRGNYFIALTDPEGKAVATGQFVLVE